MKTAQRILLAMGVFFFLLTIFFMFIKPFNDDSGVRNASLFAQYGDFIGGFFGTVFSALGFVFLFITLTEQRRQFGAEQFENQLADMIRIHRENVTEQSFIYYNRRTNDQPEQLTASQRRVFRLIFFQFEELSKELAFDLSPFENTTIYHPHYLEQLKSNSTYSSSEVDLRILAFCDLLYLILFFGSNSTGASTVRNFCKNRYLEAFYEPILTRISLKPKKESNYWKRWEQLQNLPSEARRTAESYIFLDRKSNGLIPEDRDYHWANGREQYQEKFFYSDNYDKYYGGHQHRLGHYFGHLYLTLQFINEHSNLNLTQKRFNGELVRAQLSTYEQVLLFLNSVSILGRMWEMENRLTPSVAIPINHQLITKYELIRNIYSDEVCGGIKASAFYPAINYETFKINGIDERRKELEKHWS